ncbi:MAG: FAD-dependent monooxygenase [Pseudomonadota bacterium]
MTQQTETTTVLVVGGGPTGLLASILLSKCEISHVLVERRNTTLNAPAAHVVSTRTMEVYKQAGIPVDELYALNSHPTARCVSWKSRLEDSSLGVFDMASNLGTMPARQQVSSEHSTNISQHLLEAYLKTYAERSSFADIRYGVTWQGFVDGDRQRSQIKSEVQTAEIEYAYMLGADGAASSVARALDIKKVGPDAIATFLNLTCEVDVSQASGESDSLLYWLLDPDVMGTMIVHDPRKLCVYMRPLSVPYESIDDYDDARCDVLIKTIFGDQPYRIRHKGLWKMTAQVADRFREGPVFLVGDSIHRFPPTGGLGLNTGVGDVHNLIWKIAAALKGNLSEDDAATLLDSYELERRPVAQANCDVSKENNEKMTEILHALGLDPSKAGILPKVMNSGFVKALPQGIQSMIRNALTKPLRKKLRDAQAPDSQGEAIRARVAAAIANQKEHFGSIGLDLGYVYRQGCAVTDDAANTPGSAVTTYVECVSSGARFPDRAISYAARPERLHDLLEYTGFTLLKLNANDPDPTQTFGLPMTVHDLSNTQSADNQSLVDSLGVEAVSWVLVRPDGHTMALG